LPKEYFYLLNFFCRGNAQVTGHAALLSSYSGYTESIMISICTQKQWSRMEPLCTSTVNIIFQYS